MKIAAAAYPIDWHDKWDSFQVKLGAWVAEAAGQGADLLVFPEYGAMELASLAGAEAAADPETAASAVSGLMERADALYARLAMTHGVHILGASAPVWHGARPANRARLFGPGGQTGFQDKQIMTCYERAPWDIIPGEPLTLFDTAIGRIGVLICYDAEFPLLGRALIEAGAEILLVPSCTDALSGYWRVRVGAMARALEGQCVAVHAPTVGSAAWCPPVDENVGAAAIYGPPDMGFAPTGVLAEGAINSPGWTYADVDLDAMRAVRSAGETRNMTHWAEQPERLTSLQQTPFC
ncbi:MAG: carbon-nitrogen hydrolase family protein [Paracoccaceae bacterium]